MGHPEQATRTISESDPESGPSESQEQLVKPIRSWKGYIWDTWELPADQRRLLFKVDAFVLTFASIGYFLKNIDQSNINNAFLSGMKEDMQMYGNELVTSTSIWTVGYVIGQIPSNLLLTRVSPRWVIPALEVGWGIATICTASVQSYKSLYALRFLVGLFESGFYPGIHYMLGSWYTPREIGKRAMIFWLAGSVGTLFSGFLQAAAYNNLSGVHGYAGWRWLFIVDGIITLPLAVAGFVFFPNLPQGGKKTWWTTQVEHELSVRRMQAVGREGKQPWTKAKVKKILLSWQTYLLPLLYIVWNNGYLQAGMGYWLKSFNTTPAPVPGVSYSVTDINQLPNVSTGIFIAMALVWGWLSDGPCRGARWPFIYAGAVITIVFSALLRQMPLYSNIHGRTVVYWLSNIGLGAGPLILSWINEICSNDSEMRSLLIAMANDLAYVVQAVAPNFVWKTTDFPAATKGYTWSIVLNVLLIIVTAAIQILLRRDKKRAGRVFFTDRSPIPESSEKVYKIKEAAELDTLLASTQHLVVDFYADWCPPCRAIAPHFSKLADQHALPGHLAFAKVNVDHVQKVAGRYGVTSMPTFMFFEKGVPRGPAVDGVQGRQSVLLTGDGRIDKIRGADPVALQAAVQAWAKTTEAGEQ